jgi:hypothetical protein
LRSGYWRTSSSVVFFTVTAELTFIKGALGLGKAVVMGKKKFLPRVFVAAAGLTEFRRAKSKIGRKRLCFLLTAQNFVAIEFSLSTVSLLLLPEFSF